MSKEFVMLELLEMVPERPFTDPIDTMQDVETLQYMLDRLREILTQPQGIPDRPRPLVLYAPEPDHRSHRITISRLEPLFTVDLLTVVGFCGRKIEGVNREPLDTIDEELIAEFPQHPHLLTYSTLQLPCGNACNLVLFDSPKGLRHWARGDRHSYAVALSPGYYETIRLHNAVLPGGFLSGNSLELVRTKYYDFQGDSPWWGVREMQ